MALTFAADGDRVTYNNSALGSITNGTILLWIYATDNTARQVICNQVGVPDWSIHWRADQANDPFQGFRARGSVYLEADANAANFAAYGLNKWLFLAWTWNTSGANGDQRLLMGDRVLAAAEPSSYAVQTVGSGTVDTTNADFYVGNGGVTSREFKGDVAFVQVFNAHMTNAEIISQQFRPRRTPNTVLMSWLGWNGTGTQADYSGNVISGTVTGATASTRRAPLAPPFVGVGGSRGLVSSSLTHYTLTADAGAFTYSPQAATFRAARKLTAAQADYTLTDSAASLLLGYKLAASAGAYALTVGDAVFPRAYVLGAAAAGYTLTDADAGLLTARLLTTSAGSYASTVNDAGLHKGLNMVAGAADYALTVENAGLVAARKLTASNAAYSLTDGDVNLLAARILQTLAAAYSFTPQDATLFKTGGYFLNAEAAAFALTTAATNLLAARELNAETSAYSVTAEVVNLEYGRRFVTDAAGYTLNIGDASLRAGYRFAASPAAFVAAPQDAGFRRSYLFAANVGVFTVSVADVAFTVSGASTILTPPLTFAINRSETSFNTASGETTFNAAVSKRTVNITSSDASFHATKTAGSFDIEGD